MKRLIQLIALLCVFGCGGSGGGSDGGTNEGPPISDADRAAIIQSINQQFTDIVAAGGDVDSQNQAIADVMAGMPEFEAAGTEPEFDCAWGRFTDGRLLIIGNHPFPEGTSADPGAPAPQTHPPSRSYIAKGTTARLGHMFGADFALLQNPIMDMTRYLQVDNSYTVSSPPEGKLRLSDYRAVSGDGFVYFNAHGGEGKTRSGDTVFTMVSSTPHDAATDSLPEIKADWDADRLVYYTGNAGVVNGKNTYATWYGINYKFVKQYMSFAPHAIVYLNVCYTANPHLDIGRFRQAFFDKGAGAIIAWTQLCQTSKAFDAAKYFVDRLVAKNEFQKENPEQRAFSTAEILRDMGTKNLTKEGVSDLMVVYPPGVNNVGLRPTIKYMLRDELNDYLVLHGEFGNETGVVKVNNVPATLVGGWSNSVLITRIPESGAGSDGPVVVEVNGKKSKERFLTSWRGTYAYKFQDGQSNSTLHEEMTVNFHIRMDVDEYRETAGGSILEQDPKVFYAAGDSTLTWSCGGGVTDDQGVDLSWQGGGQPAFVRRTLTAPTNAWTCIGAYDPTTHTLTFAIQNGGIKTIHHRNSADTYSMGASATYSKGLNADWSGPALDLSSGDTQSKFAAISVSWAPPNLTRSRGR